MTRANARLAAACDKTTVNEQQQKKTDTAIHQQQPGTRRRRAAAAAVASFSSLYYRPLFSSYYSSLQHGTTRLKLRSRISNRAAPDCTIVFVRKDWRRREEKKSCMQLMPHIRKSNDDNHRFRQ